MWPPSPPLYSSIPLGLGSQVFTGDNIDGGAISAAKSIAAWSGVLEATLPGVRWAAVEGNHDQQAKDGTNRTTTTPHPPRPTATQWPHQHLLWAWA